MNIGKLLKAIKVEAVVGNEKNIVAIKRYAAKILHKDHKEMKLLNEVKKIIGDDPKMRELSDDISIFNREVQGFIDGRSGSFKLGSYQSWIDHHETVESYYESIIKHLKEFESKIGGKAQELLKEMERELA